MLLHFFTYAVWSFQFDGWVNRRVLGRWTFCFLAPFVSCNSLTLHALISLKWLIDLTWWKWHFSLMVPSHRCDGCRDGPSGEWSTVSIYSHVCYLLPVYSLSPFTLLCFGISLAVSGHRGWAVTSSGPQTFSFRVEINVLYQQRLFQAHLLFTQFSTTTAVKLKRKK